MEELLSFIDDKNSLRPVSGSLKIDKRSFVKEFVNLENFRVSELIRKFDKAKNYVFEEEKGEI